MHFIWHIIIVWFIYRINRTLYPYGCFKKQLSINHLKKNKVIIWVIILKKYFWTIQWLIWQFKYRCRDEILRKQFILILFLKFSPYLLELLKHFIEIEQNGLMKMLFVSERIVTSNNFSKNQIEFIMRQPNDSMYTICTYVL